MLEDVGKRMYLLLREIVSRSSKKRVLSREEVCWVRIQKQPLYFVKAEAQPVISSVQLCTMIIMSLGECGVWKKRIKKHTNYDVLSVEAEASQGPCLAVSQVQGHASVPTASEIVSSRSLRNERKQCSCRARKRFRLTCNFFSCGRSHSNTLVCG